MNLEQIINCILSGAVLGIGIFVLAVGLIITFAAICDWIKKIKG